MVLVLLTLVDVGGGGSHTCSHAADIYGFYGGSGSSAGGSGGNGNYWSGTGWYFGGGVGNPGGLTVKGSRASNGTGGLLIIYGNSIINNSNISSSGTSTTSGNYSIKSVGGSSGGGSINLFYTSNITKGYITAAGGGNGGSYGKGGAGGDGCISTGCIATGTYVADE